VSICLFDGKFENPHDGDVGLVEEGEADLIYDSRRAHYRRTEAILSAKFLAVQNLALVGAELGANLSRRIQ